MTFNDGDLVEVYDGDQRRWIAGTVDGVASPILRTDAGSETVTVLMVKVHEPDPGPFSAEKVPSVYAIPDDMIATYVRSRV